MSWLVLCKILSQLIEKANSQHLKFDNIYFLNLWLQRGVYLLQCLEVQVKKWLWIIFSWCEKFISPFLCSAYRKSRFFSFWWMIPRKGRTIKYTFANIQKKKEFNGLYHMWKLTKNWKCSSDPHKCSRETLDKHLKANQPRKGSHFNK